MLYIATKLSNDKESEKESEKQLQETSEASTKNLAVNELEISESKSLVLRVTDLTSPSDEKELWDRMQSEEELLIGHMFESKQMTAT